MFGLERQELLFFPECLRPEIRYIAVCCQTGQPTAVLTFFIAGLLISCASSTSITWERTASRLETGLLIPSDYNNYLEVHRTYCESPTARVSLADVAQYHLEMSERLIVSSIELPVS